MGTQYNDEHSGIWMFALIVIVLVVFVALVNWTGSINCEQSAVQYSANTWHYNIFGGCYLNGHLANNVSFMDIFR